MNNQTLSPQGYNIQRDPLNRNPFWDEEGTGGNVPAGGLTGQVLTKRTAADYDTEWKTPESGGGADWPTGGADGDMLVKQGSGAAWETPEFATTAAVEAAAAQATEAQTTAAAAQSAVATEKTRAEAAEADLSTQIGDLDTEVEQLAQGAQTEFTALHQADATEKTAREAADTALGGRIDGVASDLQHYETATDSELEALATEDSRLEGLITAESTARLDADALIREDLGDDIQAEATTRAAEDTAIRALIADATGDIGAAEGAITALSTRLTTAEGDIDTLETTVQGLHGIPAGGASGQVLTKTSGTDYATEWATPSASGSLPNYHTSNSSTATATLTPVTAPPNQPGVIGHDLYLKAKLAANGQTLNYNWEEGSLPTTYGTSNGGALPFPIIYTRGDDKYRAWAFALYTTNTDRPNTKGQLLAYTGSIGNGSAASNAEVTSPISGGYAGQVLTKNSSNNYDWSWKDPSGGGADFPTGGSTGDLLSKTSDGTEWVTPTYLKPSAMSISWVTLGTLTAPDFMGFPWLTYDAQGIQRGFNFTTDAQSSDAPDTWASYYTGSTPAGSFVTSPVYFDTPLKQGSLALNNSTYGGSSGKIYASLSSDVSTAISRPFTVTGAENSTHALRFTVKLTSVDLTGISYSADVATMVTISATAGDSVTVGGKFRQNGPGTSTSYHAGGLDDFKIVVRSDGNGAFTAYLGISNSFMNYTSTVGTDVYRWHVDKFTVDQIQGA